MKNYVVLIAILVFCTHCTDGDLPSDNDKVQQTNVKDTGLPQNTADSSIRNETHLAGSENSEALKVYIDPETGEFITPPEPTDPPEEEIEPTHAFSTSHESLSESPSPVPGGGTIVDLKGRFRNPLTATRDSAGKIKIGHSAVKKKE